MWKKYSLPCIDRIIRRQFSKNLSPNQLITYIEHRQPSVDNLPSGKEKGATNWIRHQLLGKEPTAGKYFEKRFLQSSLPGHQANTFLLPSFLLWTLLTLSPKSTCQIDKSCVYNISITWDENLWYDLMWAFQIHETGPQQHTGTVSVEIRLGSGSTLYFLVAPWRNWWLGLHLHRHWLTPWSLHLKLRAGDRAIVR